MYRRSRSPRIVRGFTAWTLIALALTVGHGAVAATEADLPAIDQAIGQALSWLSTQRDDRSAWRSDYGPGIAGLVLTAYLRDPSGRYDASSPEVAPGLAFLASLQRADGSVYDPNSKVPLPNYNTSVSLMALSSAGDPQYADITKRAQAYLMQSQWDEGEGASPEDSNYGGIGYGSDPSVRDLSNLNLALQSLKESGVPEDAQVWDKAIHFLERVQNRSETNDMPTAGDDGGFVYSPGVSKAGADAQGSPRSYATMTYAGMLSFIYANLASDDPRVQAAHEWLQRHWSTDENYPIGQQGLYYGYHTMAKALSAYGDAQLPTPDGAIDWYGELSSHLLATQQPDGSWPANEADRWFEGDPVLVTAYALLALEAGYPEL